MKEHVSDAFCQSLKRDYEQNDVRVQEWCRENALRLFQHLPELLVEIAKNTNGTIPPQHLLDVARCFDLRQKRERATWCYLL